MKQNIDYINKILCGNDLEILPKLPSESINCCITSPPYWGLRDYGIEPVIWDEKECEHEFSISSQSPIKHKPGETNPGKEAWYKDKGGIGNPDIRCEHDFNEYDSKLLHENRQNLDGGTLGNPEYRKNLHGFGKAKAGFCSKCGAWRGSLGLEPTFDLYIKHLCDIFDEIKRVLREDGTCFVNIGDSYGGSGNASGHTKNTKNLGYKTSEMGATQGNQRSTGQYAKSLLDIPYRFSIEMINRGWIKRNTLIWYKPNCMPSSASDRFTIDFEYLFFFTKNNKAIFWTNEKTLECVDKQPLGIKGIKGKDWEWRRCSNCEGTGKVKVNIKDRPEIYGENDPTGMRRGRMRDFLDKKKEMYQAGDKPCERCKGSGKIKYSFWTGHDYWFEQQFEEYAPDTLPRMERGVNINKWTFGADGQTPHNLSQPRLNKKRGYKTKQSGKEIQGPQYHGKDIGYDKQGRNKRCVWIIPTQPFPEAHFAVYPEGLIETPIKAGCPEFICKKCGKARVKIINNSERINTRPGKNTGKGKKSFHKDNPQIYLHKDDLSKYRQQIIYKETGYSNCGCNAGFEPGIVLDPFMGAGTTALVALKQRKRFIGIDIKQEYIDMSYKRIAKVQQKMF